MVESDAGRPLSVILMEEGEQDWSSSLNAYLLAEGLAILEQYIKQSADADVPEQVTAWTQFEEEARDGSAGLWQHGDAAGILNDDDEDY